MENFLFLLEFRTWRFYPTILILWCFLSVKADEYENGILHGESNQEEYAHPIAKRIVGGEGTKPQDFPFLLLMEVYHNETWTPDCGASIISEMWAITAAHCVEDVLPEQIRLLAGEHDRDTEEGTEVYRNVSVIKAHRDYTGEGGIHHDIALLKFAQPIVFTQHVQSIPLASKKHIAAGTVLVAGWGRTTEGGPSSRYLLMAELFIHSRKKCNKIYEETLHENQLCAWFRRGGKDTCQGDSGGPLVQKAKNGKDFVLVGIVSYGIGCGLKGFPGVYLNVSSYRDWIDKIIKLRGKSGKS